jgi:predicted ArsR family transcriptional regulator
MSIPADTELNAIGVLKRRTIEARILAPLLQALGEEFGRERVLQVTRDVITAIAREQGAALAQAAGSDTLPAFADTLDRWTADDALHLTVLEQSPERFAFNVTRCRYAEMYRALGIPELGAILSCNRDGALMEGFNPAVQFERTQTLMQGASHCDFRYQLTSRRLAQDP